MVNACTIYAVNRDWYDSYEGAPGYPPIPPYKALVWNQDTLTWDDVIPFNLDDPIPPDFNLHLSYDARTITDEQVDPRGRQWLPTSATLVGGTSGSEVYWAWKHGVDRHLFSGAVRPFDFDVIWRQNDMESIVEDIHSDNAFYFCGFYGHVGWVHCKGTFRAANPAEGDAYLYITTPGTTLVNWDDMPGPLTPDTEGTFDANFGVREAFLSYIFRYAGYYWGLGTTVDMFTADGAGRVFYVSILLRANATDATMDSKFVFAGEDTLRKIFSPIHPDVDTYDHGAFTELCVAIRPLFWNGYVILSLHKESSYELDGVNRGGEADDFNFVYLLDSDGVVHDALEFDYNSGIGENGALGLGAYLHQASGDIYAFYQTGTNIVGGAQNGTNLKLHAKRLVSYTPSDTFVWEDVATYSMPDEIPSWTGHMSANDENIFITCTFNVDPGSPVRNPLTPSTQPIYRLQLSDSTWSRFQPDEYQLQAFDYTWFVRSCPGGAGPCGGLFPQIIGQ